MMLKPVTQNTSISYKILKIPLFFLTSQVLQIIPQHAH